MALLLPALLILGLIFLANLVDASENRTARIIFYLLLILLNVPVVILGVALVMIDPAMLGTLPGVSLDLFDAAAAGWTLLGVGLWGLLVCLPALRRGLARVSGLNAGSAVHALALLLAGYMVGNTFFTLTQGGLAELAGTAVTVSIVDIVLQQVLFAASGFLGVGLLVRRDLRASLQRLGLQPITWPQLRRIPLWIGGMVVLQWAVGIVWALTSPEQAQVLGNLNESLMGDFDTVGEWLILAVSAGIGEEVLFRGAVQPIFGLVPTALLFSIIHVQYGFTPITLLVFVLGLLLGIIRQRSGTTMAVLVHVGYNFVLGLLSLLATYLQQFVP